MAQDTRDGLLVELAEAESPEDLVLVETKFAILERHQQ